MNKRNRFSLASQVADSVRELEYAGFEHYEIVPNNHKNRKVKSPRVIRVYSDGEHLFSIYNKLCGETWVTWADRPKPRWTNVNTNAELREFLATEFVWSED